MLLAPAIPDEETRLRAVRALHLMDTPPEERFDRVTRLAAELFEIPIAYVSLIDASRQFFKSRVGFDLCETPRDVSFCSQTIVGDGLLVVLDARSDPRFAENPFVTGAPFLRFYAGRPLRGPNGQKVGTFCLMDQQPRDFSPGRLRIFENLAAIVEGELAMTDVIEAQAELLRTKEALIKTQQHLQTELAEAAKYVEALLPRPIAHPWQIDWRFVPSDTLGGDGFGYHDLGDGRFALYLLDVCGHGVGSALLSVALLSVLRAQSLPQVDFACPAEVLTALNREFPMARHGNRYFTIWYGVLESASGRLTYANGGHPPALVIETDGTVERLGATGMCLGVSAGAGYESAQYVLRPGAVLYLFSDGAYEMRLPGERFFSADDFAVLLAQAVRQPRAALDFVLRALETLTGSSRFPDDFSLLEIRSGAGT